MNWMILKQISFFKTVKMNIHYFGWGGGFQPRILVSRNVKLVKMSGSVVAPKRIGSVKLGFGEVGIIDNKYRRTLWENRGKILFENKVSLGAGTKIACNGELSFGFKCHINGNSDIICWKKIHFGDEAMVSWECLFMDTDFHAIYDIATNKRINPDKEIKIGKHVWIGSRCTILKGASLPDNSIVAACSLITKPMNDDYCIYSTNEVLKRNVCW